MWKIISLNSWVDQATGVRQAVTCRSLLQAVVIDYSVVWRYILAVKDVAYSRTAVRALARMPRNLANRIRSKIRAYAENPASQAVNVARLRGQDGLLRLRVGDWRVVMRDADVLQVLHVASRGSIYKD